MYGNTEPTPREMSDQIRRLYREGDSKLLNLVCNSVTLRLRHEAKHQTNLAWERNFNLAWDKTFPARM